MNLISLLALAAYQGAVTNAVELGFNEAKAATTLAQMGTEQQSWLHFCSSSHDLLKLPLPEIFNQKQLYTDHDFPKEDALYWGDFDSELNGQVS